MRLLILMVLQLIIFYRSYSNGIDGVNPSKDDRPANHYRLFSVAFSNTLYRDFATSPLFYTGIGFASSYGWLKRSKEHERLFQIGSNISSAFALIPESDFIQPIGFAVYGNLNLYYHQLWNVKPLSTGKNSIDLGGSLICTQNFRTNSSLQNNALGIENLSNLMASFRLSRDISRKESKQINLLIFKPSLKPVKRDIRFLLNVGVLNFNYRPGYAYSYDDEIIGLETSPLSWILSNYSWSLNGWRLNTELEYISYLPNGNARSFAYIWEAAHAPGKYEAFQMANHRIQFTYYFQIK